MTQYFGRRLPIGFTNAFALASALLDTASRVPLPDVRDRAPALVGVRSMHSPPGRPLRRRSSGRARLGRPKCEPGTITYHDKLVRHFGRRKADEIGRRIQRGDLAGLPFVSEGAK